MQKILITMGDPAGIGPEVIVKCLAKIGHPEGLEVAVVGERDILEETAKALGIKIQFCPDDSPRQGRIKVRSMDLARSGDFELGKVSALCGNAAYHYFAHAVEACLAGEAQGIVTAPINKEAMNLAGHHYVGHTDILEKMTGSETVIMALVHPKIIVSHVTDHLPLRKALDHITLPRIKEVVKLTWKTLVATRTHTPRIALAGVNPHAGENGLFGREEIEILRPAMEELRAEGFPTFGPLPGDTVFLQALKGRFDAVIAMYHDQGFGPMKTVDMANGVNCTLGLPFVRTSPDHGTAFEIAGSGLAEPESMITAWDVAAQLLRAKTLHHE
ncbi:MAG: 4-hydroxythreonine-4-phosphate dehydrogenase PdxA [Fibrobacteria bacterium]